MHPFLAIAITFAFLHGAPAEIPELGRRVQDKGITVSVMTYNIRFDNPDDGLHAWPHRRSEFGTFLRSFSPDVLCVQEALRSQVLDLASELPGYEWRGVGRDDGGAQGEHCAIFFDTHRFACASDSTLWLSPTPVVPSKGWDAALPRIVTWVELCEKTTGKRVIVFNTHFDHAGSEARANSAALARSLAFSRPGKMPAVLAGDFNCDETEAPYAVLTRGDSSGVLYDTQALAGGRAIGPHGTFCGFPLTEQIAGPRIDFVFVTQGISVKRQETLRAVRSEGFLSDHLPVIATLIVP